jgi:Fic family protein
LIALAYTSERTRKAYYSAVERNNKDIEITDWLVYFAETINQAQAIFREGIDGFRGDLSAENYITITKTSTATRDLQVLVTMGAVHEDGRASSHPLSPGSGANQRLSPMQDANVSDTAPH